jgi:SAM-dependent methyltransferase
MSSTFEERYSAEPDPWRTLTDPYERNKMERTLEACGPGPFTAVCDLGAGIGGLTVRLAPRARSLLALDAAPTAVAAARERLATFAQAEVRVAALPDQLPDGPFDLVVASEVLYYLRPGGPERVAAWLETALVPGGRVVAVHWTGWATDLRHDADEVAATLRARPGLGALDGGDVHDGFRIDVLERIA